jgi:cysteine-rich repeat protein
MDMDDFTRRERIGRRALLVVMFCASQAGAGCGGGTATRLCEDGTRCPAGTVCSVAFGQVSVCVPERGCGNGVVDPGEVCDDGNVISGDGCSADCRALENCGNGVMDEGEVCDDGNVLGGDGCSADCASDETCGNGVIDFAVGEACDDGNTVSGDGCSGDCRVRESCGNGYLDLGEVCDDGNTVSGTGAAATATRSRSAATASWTWVRCAIWAIWMATASRTRHRSAISIAPRPGAATGW